MSEIKVIGKIIQSPVIVGEIKTEIIEAKAIVGHSHLNKALLDNLTNENLDKFYIHDQMIPSSEWEIIHDLKKYPSVTIVDSAGSVVIGEVMYTSENTVTVRFSSAFAGKAYCN